MTVTSHLMIRIRSETSSIMALAMHKRKYVEEFSILSWSKSALQSFPKLAMGKRGVWVVGINGVMLPPNFGNVDFLHYGLIPELKVPILHFAGTYMKAISVTKQDTVSVITELIKHKFVDENVLLYDYMLAQELFNKINVKECSTRAQP